MSEALEKTWAWIYRAPLPAVLGFVLLIGAWVFVTQDAVHAEQTAIRARQENLATADTALAARLAIIEGKLDNLLEAVLESRVQQRAIQDRLDRSQARRDDPSNRPFKPFSRVDTPAPPRLASDKGDRKP